jgi:L,D-peptidoglycan transpeptidase YkuD (ErfK/YbiS/YcfS/YnhG family)
MKITVFCNPADFPCLMMAGQQWPCQLGRAGYAPAALKTEGDGKTPLGNYQILRGFYRADRLAPPTTAGLAMVPIAPDMGWDDDSASPTYNQLMMGYLPTGAETFWRADGVYDLILVLNHNAAWPFATPAPQAAEKHKGSAIFLHVGRSATEPTAGCVATALEHWQNILPLLQPNHPLEITDATAPKV